MKIFSAALNVFLTSSIILANRSPEETVLRSPLGDQMVSQPAGTTLSVNSLNGQLTVSAPTGTDISEAVSIALSNAGSTCGTVTIAPGSYAWRNGGIKMLPCETLQGVGATILVAVSGANPFLIVEGPAPGVPTTNDTYTMGSLRGITFVGPSAPTSQSSSTGIELGGTSPTEQAQLFNLYDVHVRNFGCGINIDWAHQIAFFGGSIEGNFDGICFSNIITGLENINFHGTQILNNIDYGIDDDRTGVYVELSLTDCSIDYNGQYRTTGGEIQITNGKLIISGSHLENNTLPMITVREPGAPASVDVYIAGTAFNLVDQNASRTYASFISVKGLSDVLEIGRGVSFGSQGARVEAVADWAPVYNPGSRLMMDPYTYTVGVNQQGLPAFVGMTPPNYSYPTYDIHDNVTGIASSFVHEQLQRYSER